MKEVLQGTISLAWIPISDKQHYPLMGIHPLFFQNVLELFFLVGFVWDLHWSPLLVVFYCIAEVFVLAIFNAYKTKNSWTFSKHNKQGMVIASVVLCLLLSASQLFVLLKSDPQGMTLPAVSTLIWNDNEFLLCLLAIVLQQTMEYYKYSKTELFFSADLFQSFVVPSLKLWVQQVFFLCVLLFFLYMPTINLLVQSIVLAFGWVVVKAVLGQVGVSSQVSGISNQ